MVTLALIPPPVAPLSYPAFNALAAGAGALGATYSAAKAAALAAMASTAAAALGAGLGGFLLGQAILAGLNEPPVLPDMGEYFEAGNPQQLVRLTYDYFLNGEQLVSDGVSQFILAPIKGMFFRVIQGAATWFVFDGQGLQQNIISSSNTVSGTRFELKGFINGQSQPITPTKRLPSYVPKNPDRPQPLAPIPIPVPGLPPVPITPQVIPNPGNDEPEENESRPPGVLVQIPQTGQQFLFTPSGVSISNYNNAARAPFVVPTPVFPPGGTPATPRCCESDAPEPEPSRDKEIICRIKTLQDEILDDGTDRRNVVIPNGNSGRYEEFDAEFYKVRIQVVSKPANAKIQPSTSPAQDVLYAGWYSWLEGGFEGDRYPIHFENSSILAPPNVTGFVFQMNQGYVGTATLNIRTKRPYVDNCEFAS